MEAIEVVWDRIITAQPRPSSPALIATFLVAVAIVLIDPVWRVARHVITIVHEGAHGLAAAMSGRKLAGIRLHSDSSGVTVSSGRPTGPGMVATAAAGYLGPALLGWGCSTLLATGRAVAVIWLLLACLAVLLLQIRNLFGLAIVGSCGVAVFVVSWQVAEQAQVLFAHLVTFFLLVAAPRPILEMHALRRRGTRSTDADQLARLSRLPAWLWVWLLLLVTVVALVAGMVRLRP